MERLKRQEGPTDILERQVALIESISGNLLVAGNQVTWLIDPLANRRRELPVRADDFRNILFLNV